MGGRGQQYLDRENWHVGGWAGLVSRSGMVILCVGGLVLLTSVGIRAATTNGMMLDVSHYVRKAQPLGNFELIESVPRQMNTNLTAAQATLIHLSERYPVPRTFEILAAVSLLAGDTRQAQLAIERANNPASTTMLQAYLHSQLGHPELVCEVLRRTPEVSATLVGAGIRGPAAGNLADAFAVIKLAECIDGLANLNVTTTHTAYWILSRGAMEVNEDQPQAVRWAERWIQVMPQAREAYFQLASLYTMWRTQPDKARQVLTQIEELGFQQDYRYYYNWGLVYRAEGELNQAAVFFTAAARAQPDDLYLAWHWGETLFRLGRYQEAQMPLEQVATLLTRDPQLQERALQMLRQVAR